VTVQGGAHDLIHHIKGRQGGGVDFKQPVGGRQQVDLALMGLILPGNTIAGQGFCQNGGGLVFMDLVFCQIDDVQVVFTELLKVANIVVADRVALVKGGTLEFPGANLGNVMGQLSPNGIF